MRTVSATRPVTGLLAAIAGAMTLGCATTGSSLRVEDARLAFAVRTALVNDAAVGTSPIEVTVASGVVTLAGQVPSTVERHRAVALVRSVPGVRGIVDALSVGAIPRPGQGPPPPAGQLRRRSALADAAMRPLPRLFAVGGILTVPVSNSDALEGLPTFGPVFRLGRGAGWHPQVTLARVGGHLPATAGTGTFGDLRMLIAGGGLGYGFRWNRWTLSVGASAAVSFNRVILDPGPVLSEDVALPVAASTSPALLAGSTVWYDVNRRLSIGFTTAYLLTRPQVTWLDGNRFVDRRLNADTVRIGVNAAWWLF